MPAEFRQALAGDIPQMARIRLAVTENVLRDPARVTMQMYADFLEKDGRGWVAQIDGETVAFSYANRIDGSIWALFVDPHYEGQGQGLATRLLALATDWLFSLGFAQVTLSTGLDTRAARFYTRQGWRRSVSTGDDVHFVLDAPP
jgi:GNAT superfamily N-acetyltransferase